MLIRRYRDEDRPDVIRLFREFMAEYSGPGFAAYVERAIGEELGRIAAYYGGERQGFWVAEEAGALVGMAGVERQSETAAELRRMVVDKAHRRRGIARALLATTENFCRDAGYAMFVLNTSGLQVPAMRLYESSGYRHVRTASPAQTTHKTVGGLERHYYEKTL
jgi:GNAT superfamily N-acetyltransferase